MEYNTYDLPSAVTEEGLASIVCGGVRDYLSGVTDYVARCHTQAAEQQEIIDALEAQNHALQRQVEELKQCLAMRSQAMSFNKVGTVVAHADNVTLQCQGL